MVLNYLCTSLVRLGTHKLLSYPELCLLFYRLGYVMFETDQ